MDEREDKPDPNDTIEKVVRLLESKAKTAGVTCEEYARGIVDGKYPSISDDELDALLDECTCGTESSFVNLLQPANTRIRASVIP